MEEKAERYSKSEFKALILRYRANGKDQKKILWGGQSSADNWKENWDIVPASAKITNKPGSRFSNNLQKGIQSFRL